jgi:chromate transporter
VTDSPVPLHVVCREWGRIGITGFGGPPTHIAMLRGLVVQGRSWIPADEFESAIAACNLLPGPASTQLAIFCAHRVAGRRGAIVGGLAFVAPAVVIVLVLSLLFLAASPPLWVRGAGDGAGAVIAPVAVAAGWALLLPSRRRARAAGGYRRLRWSTYVVLGGTAAALVGPYLVVVLLVCGFVEVAVVEGTRGERGGVRLHGSPLLLIGALSGAVAAGGWLALVWEAFKVGALSYGGGFVIVPLMQHDAVHTYHWMTSAQFLNAVALGQVTPGPVVATVAAVGYAAHGVGGGALAAVIAFAPSFTFVLLGASHFQQLRESARAQAFLDGAGPAAIGAILGSAIPLAEALRHGWQFGLMGVGALALLVARRRVVQTLLAAGAIGAIAVLAGAPA